MKLGHLTIGRRIWVLAGGLLLLLVLAGALSVTGVGRIIHNAEAVIGGNRLDGILAQREVDHLNWVNKVNGLFTDSQVAKLEVETDDHKCGFGKWLYGEGRKEAELLVPTLAPLLLQIEVPHRQLHASAIEIGARFRPTDVNLGNFLREKKLDHLVWTNRVQDALLKIKAESIGVEMDPTKCGLGRWLLSDQVTARAAADAEFGKLLERIKVPHEALHRSAAEIETRLIGGDHDGAHAYYVSHTQTFAEQTLKAVDAMIADHEKAMEAVRAAKAVYTEQTVPALREVQAQLGQIRAKAKEGILSDEVMLSAARSTRSGVMVCVAVAMVFGLVLAVLISGNTNSALRKVSDGIQEAASQVASAAVQVSSASQSLAEGAAEQAASVEETSASVQQMSAQGKQTSDLTQGASQLMNRNIEKSAQSLKSLVDLTRQMSQIEADSDQIGNIIKTIDQIAFQTNLLALNAAVEAARAGEAGSGFAVVADEVRNLALRATEAARDTQVLLDGTLNRVHDATAAIKNINLGFEDIIESATVMGEKTAAITDASVQQASGLDQISTAMNQIGQVTQQVAAGAEEAAASSEELNAQAEEMRKIVNNLAKMVYGSA